MLRTFQVPDQMHSSQVPSALKDRHAWHRSSTYCTVSCRNTTYCLLFSISEVSRIIIIVLWNIRRPIILWSSEMHANQNRYLLLCVTVCRCELQERTEYWDLQRDRVIKKKKGQKKLRKIRTPMLNDRSTISSSHSLT